jgi:hypothetical protein
MSMRDTSRELRRREAFMFFVAASKRLKDVMSSHDPAQSGVSRPYSISPSGTQTLFIVQVVESRVYTSSVFIDLFYILYSMLRCMCI